MNKEIAIITGSRRGIGRGIAEALGKEGYHIIVSATAETAEDVISELKEEQISCEYVKCDVSKKEDRISLVDYVWDKFGRVDVLVNNAGVAPTTRLDILETTEESYDRVVNINSRSTFFMCQLIANRMIELKQSGNVDDYNPRIINISSMSAYTSSTSRGEYCISKAAVSMVTQLFADRLAEYEIPVFEVRPGIIMTDMTKAVKEKYAKLIEDGITPIKRFGYPKDIANCVVALCSGLLDFSTGQVLNADGGFHLRRL